MAEGWNEMGFKAPPSPNHSVTVPVNAPVPQTEPLQPRLGKMAAAPWGVTGQPGGGDGERVTWAPPALPARCVLGVRRPQRRLRELGRHFVPLARSGAAARALRLWGSARLSCFVGRGDAAMGRKKKKQLKPWCWYPSVWDAADAGSWVGEGSGAAWRGRGSVPFRLVPRWGSALLRTLLTACLGAWPCSSPVLLVGGPSPCPSCAPHRPHGLRPAPVALAEAAASRPIVKAGAAGNGELALSLAREDVKGRKSCYW